MSDCVICGPLFIGKCPHNSDPARAAPDGPLEPEMAKLLCLYCERPHYFPLDSNEATGVFNVFCPNGECEDRYAARL